MYPHSLFLGVGLYEICIVLAIIAAMVVFRILGDKANLSANLQNTVLIGIPVALFIGYPSAVVVQWVYNGIRDGEFAASVFGAETGSTFYGGLIGGSAAFLIYYFTMGHFRCKDREHFSAFPKILDLGPCCIALGHAIGRIGCFFAGCCYGVRTDSALGVYMGNLPYKVLPTQLFEAFFLIVMFAFLMLRFYDGQKYNLSCYLIGYGIWRFVIEYLRGDDRGETFVDFLTPSQLTAIVLILLGIALFFLMPKLYARFPSETPPAEGKSVSAPEAPSADSENGGDGAE